MLKDRIIKILVVSILLTIPILATDQEQSGANLASEILDAVNTTPAPTAYVPSNEELAEIENLQKDPSLSWQLNSKNMDNLSSKKGVRTKIIQNIIQKLEIAAASGKQGTVEFLLNQIVEKQTLLEGIINRTIKSAAIQGQQNMVEFLLNREQKPTQKGINRTLQFAAENNQAGIVQFLLNLPDGRLRPNDDAIISAYREAIAHNHHALINFLQPLLPEEEITSQALEDLFQNFGYYPSRRSPAVEIHDYANTVIETSPSKTSIASFAPVNPTLYDAALENITMRMQDQPLIDLEEAQHIISKGIEEHIAPDQQEQAAEALSKMVSAMDQQILQLVLSFIRKFYPDNLHLWVKGFIEESIVAYINSINKISCSKGVKERSITGLRGIDSELDNLFAPAEGKLLFVNWLKTWNLSDVKEEIKPTLAKQLISKGINCESSAEDVAKVFVEIANEELHKQGLSDNANSNAEIDAYAEFMVETNYDEMLKPFVIAELAKTRV
jgi:hypothetical protein